MPYLNADTSSESDPDVADLERYKLLAVMSGPDADELEEQYPGWHKANFAAVTSWIDTRLRKRYAAPFQAPYVPALEQWLCAIVGLRAFLKKGVRQTDEQFQQVVKDDTTARAEIKEAADSVAGLFDLPLRSDNTTSAITKGGPLAYSEASPYVGFDAQASIGRGEDQSGRGT